MDTYKIIEVKESVFADNDREAARVREALKQKGTFLLNLMSSPGSGKTTTLLRTIEALKDELRMGVMEADIDSDVDAADIAVSGASGSMARSPCSSTTAVSTASTRAWVSWFPTSAWARASRSFSFYLAVSATFLRQRPSSCSRRLILSTFLSMLLRPLVVFQQVGGHRAAFPVLEVGAVAVRVLGQGLPVREAHAAALAADAQPLVPAKERARPGLV